LGLDELPQVFNILKGEMSLVGPRPCLPYEHESYRPRHKRRYDTLPGLTGFWQANGKNKTTFRRMIAMDLWYVKNKSVLVDLGIIFKTVPAIIAQVLETRQNKLAAKKGTVSLGKTPASLIDQKPSSV
jgi:lipopolysaccharide/colanic/teichoic acid biosynthesis glycosyltransferase